MCANLNDGILCYCEMVLLQTDMEKLVGWVDF